MNYEWDEAKNLVNLDKHGYTLSMARFVFEDPYLTRVDDRQVYGEDRYITMGTLGPLGDVVIVAHTFREGVNRIISLRRANSRERRIFENAKEVIHV